MPSSQTRRKIKGFAFSHGAPSSQELRKREAERARRKAEERTGQSDHQPQNTTTTHMNIALVASQDKENMSMPSKAKETPKTARMVQIAESKTSITPRLEKSNTCPFPSTPATRLPLADLIGNADDTNRRLPQPVQSPDEQLCWRGSQPVNTPQPRRKRKRARSSSPVGGSQDEVQFPAITTDLDTPQADPAAELWNRYTSTKGTPSTKKGVAFAHLLNDPSPRSSADAGSVSGLRRWTSCGAEFPTSATKRRQPPGAFRAKKDDGEDVFSAPSSDGVFKPPPKKSRLAGMLEEMSQSVARPSPRIATSDIPSSSSPLPDNIDRRAHPSSPLQCHAQDDCVASETLRVHEEPPKQEEVIANPEQSFSASSDDFGDDDFDAEMVEALDISQRVEESAHHDLPSPSRQQGQLPPRIPQPNLPAPASEISDDEFGLDDDDLCAADFEQVASLYDARPVLATQDAEHANEVASRGQENTGPAEVIVLDGGDDEDFGDDDIDADDFEEAVQIATQSAANNSQHDARAIQRYKITRVDEGSYINEHGYQMPEKVSTVRMPLSC
ncbi:hypothetical protein BU24DRAFT_111950 [Aaosphaeria arxii CBS 175.79]|uniref:Uncharacterized protein n=1 Tax=Aaosphaeria arxii CBS 175.79 TaxID=1450172 RepID=A0A6A5Y3B2_9PLEO|nr:uncharacterized protein BU24DRAFT_111950 [Aaosphaeria arxii CBS 175.79]KAF2019074.1 hypothetical protein BU24DRAFT_111950 [Aaosphaeria arxii CBS 175.79]